MVVHVFEGVRRELDGCLISNRPVGNQQGFGSSIKEGAGEAGQGLGSWFVASRCIAGRHHNPVGIKLEFGDFGSCQQAIIQNRRLGGQREGQGRFAQPLDITSNQSVGGEIYNAVLVEFGGFDGPLAGGTAQLDTVCVHLQHFGDACQFGACPRQGWQGSGKCGEVSITALEKTRMPLTVLSLFNQGSG